MIVPTFGTGIVGVDEGRSTDGERLLDLVQIVRGRKGGAATMNRGPILLLDLADCRDKAIAGGKAVNLGVLIRAGFPVVGKDMARRETGCGRRARRAGNQSARSR